MCPGEWDWTTDETTLFRTLSKITKVLKCKFANHFFLQTLGYKATNDRIIQNVLTTAVNHITPKRDMRGKKSPPFKCDRSKLRLHIMSFRPSISHYRREHAPKRRYLPSDVCVALMHTDFKEKHPDIKCSYDVYRTAVKELNISFTKLGHEECELCESFNEHEHTKETLDADCGMCNLYISHIDRMTKSRKLYREDADSKRTENDICYSADLEKVIMLPRMEEFKIALFTPRIVLFNESFVPVGKKQAATKPFASIWHEGISGRKKEDLISSFHAFLLHNRDAEKITLWLDNCSAQNKNWALFSFFVYIVNSTEINTNEIDIKYFEPGHSFMSADSFHHQVELSMKRKGKLYDFNDFKAAVQKANSGNVDVNVMKIDDFSSGSTIPLILKLKRPHLAHI